MFKDSKYLFLDRDGVINQRIIGGYVLDYKDFVFSSGVLSALELFAKRFERIFVVTNQQCIGKGLLTEKKFSDITKQMLQNIEQAGGRIDKVYHCPFLKTDNSPLRKPNNGMALLAKKDFPEVDFAKSIMVGDSNSDMIFGKSVGMKTIFIDNQTGEPYQKELIDKKYYSLQEFAQEINK
ncbi:MAG: HAD-IIIA family hydrolase [Bacteroidota bacterium]|nr:HAD-IIIA family hydrolase [Bacteroidota bacterium]